MLLAATAAWRTLAMILTAYFDRFPVVFNYPASRYALGGVRGMPAMLAWLASISRCTAARCSPQGPGLLTSFNDADSRRIPAVGGISPVL